MASTLIAFPATCHAEQKTVWQFANETKVEGWNTNNLTSVQLIPQGLSITTQTNGQLVKTSAIAHSVDRIAISYISPTGGQGIFLWQPPHMEGSNVFQIPITFKQSSATQKLVLDVSQIPQWDERSDRIGFVINAGTNIIFEKVELSGPSFVDRIVFPLRSFFHFDVVRAYSINFLWGPMMTYGQEQLDALHTTTPPNADSWNGVLYVVLAGALVIGLLLKKMGMRRALGTFFVFFALLWILYDIRMGTELISFARTDIKTWWMQPAELQDFRDRGSFTAYTKIAKTFVEEKDRYVFIAPGGWPYWGAMRYESYPAVPASHEGNTEGIDMWLIYSRSDITQDEERRLVMNGAPISPPGDIIFPFEPNSFVFVTDSDISP